MDADIVIDNEFQASQTHTLIGDGLEFKSQLRIADIHHDLHGNIRQGAALDFFNLNFLTAFVDLTGIAFGARNGHFHIFGQAFGCIAATDHSRNTQFTSNNGCVASTTATVGHNSAGTLHHRFPVRIGHIGNQNVTGLNTFHFACIFNDTHRTHADLLTDSAAGHQHTTFAL